MTARVAGALWLAAGLAYVVCETVSASRYPGYSYARDYISALGIPGRSPSAGLMNAGAFVAHGVLFAAAGTVLALSCGRVRRAVVVAALAITNGVGNLLVGLFHAGASPLHGLGALLAIVGGNAAIIAAAGLLGGIDRLAVTFRVLGALGIVSFVALLAISSLDTGVEGAVERGAVYPIIVWDIVIGIALIGRRRQVSRCAADPSRHWSHRRRRATPR